MMATSKLTDDEAMKIIELALEGNLDVRKEADYYGTGFETIRRIARRETYRHLWSAAGSKRDVRVSVRARDIGETDEEARASALKVKQMLKELGVQGDDDEKIGCAF